MGVAPARASHAGRSCDSARERSLLLLPLLAAVGRQGPRRHLVGGGGEAAAQPRVSG